MAAACCAGRRNGVRAMTRFRDEEDAGEAALDETLAATFPASDPLSTDPNPGHPDEHVRSSEEEARRRQRTPDNDSDDGNSDGSD